MDSDLPARGGAGDGPASRTPPPFPPRRLAPGLPVRVGDPLLPGGLAPISVPPVLPGQEVPPPIPGTVAAALATEPPPRAVVPRRGRVARVWSRWRGGPRWARLVTVGGAVVMLGATLALAGWHLREPYAEAGIPDLEAAPAGPDPVEPVPAQRPESLPARRGSPPGVVTPSTTAPSASPSAAASEPAATPAAVPGLAASLETDAGLFGREVTVTVTNPGPDAAPGWEVVITIASGQAIRDVSGAEHRREGSQVIFTPLAGSGELPPGEAVTFDFELPGMFAPGPEDCAIDGRPCQ